MGLAGVANSRLANRFSGAIDCATQQGQSFDFVGGTSVFKLMVCLDPSTTHSSMVRKFSLADWKKACAIDGVKILHEKAIAHSQ